MNIDFQKITIAFLVAAVGWLGAEFIMIRDLAKQNSTRIAAKENSDQKQWDRINDGTADRYTQSEADERYELIDNRLDDLENDRSYKRGFEDGQRAALTNTRKGEQ